MKPFVLAVVFARGGSKGIPRKNIKMLCGKPLMAYAIEAAKGVKGVGDVIVSTEDEEIARVAKKHGAAVPFMRPAQLATDAAPEILAWQHALSAYEQVKHQRVDVLLSVPATSPLRAVADVQGCLDALLSADADCAIVITDAHRSPYFNMVRMDAKGYAKVVMAPEGEISRRQDAPAVYDITTIAYAVRGDYLRQARSALGGRVVTFKAPVERSLDIDTPLDWELAEFLLSRRGR